MKRYHHVKAPMPSSSRSSRWIEDFYDSDHTDPNYWQDERHAGQGMYLDRQDDYHRPYSLINRNDFHGMVADADHPPFTLLVDSDRPSSHIYPEPNSTYRGQWPTDVLTDYHQPVATRDSEWIRRNISNQTVYSGGGKPAKIKSGTYLGTKGEVHPGLQWYPMPKEDNIPDYIDWGDLNGESIFTMTHRTDDWGDRVLYS